ncbi:MULTISPECIES: LysE family translocator [unclassified Kitasatospora]|uniref:LysE family translocator n=1 Tax=unclassified Kitasatospora TaxID=2633591 RepID=UPI000708BD8F|nr:MULTISPECIES: LysE family translocator [unclassified Kitasatospora]KQV04660.1 lysine transporter LysE [Kitasatospora sp. Root107]KRB60814.1 lysine transporter LysE [Kitasatospora sp. Root187]
MGTTTAVWSFALVVGLLTLTPGLDTALILRTAALGERVRAWGVVLGIGTGTLIWGTLSSLGVSALLTASHLAYETLRWAGVAYLLWMGVQMLRSSALSGPEPDVGSGGFWSGWRRGALTNLLNPKVGVFYVAVLPQFIPAGVPHLPMGVLLTSVHVAEGLLWSAVLVAFARAVRGWLRRPAARKLMDRLTGVVVIGFGLRLATTD